jgi:hypothetical protein
MYQVHALRTPSCTWYINLNTKDLDGLYVPITSGNTFQHYVVFYTHMGIHMDVLGFSKCRFSQVHALRTPSCTWYINLNTKDLDSLYVPITSGNTFQVVFYTHMGIHMEVSLIRIPDWDSVKRFKRFQDKKNSHPRDIDMLATANGSRSLHPISVFFGRRQFVSCEENLDNSSHDQLLTPKRIRKYL